jgi:phospholipid/cholesterol/gamma-HCH transport system substrate-binding protein
MAEPDNRITALEIKPTPGMRLRIMALLSGATVLSLILMYLLVGGGQDFFAERTTLTTYMPDSAGITTNSEVRLSGIRIGKVQKVELSGLLDPRRSVRAEMRVLTRYLKGIPQDSQTNVSADTLVGYQFIDIAEGKSPVPIGENGVLESEPVKDAADRADLIKTLQSNLSQVDQILADLSSPDTPTGGLVVGEELYDTLLSTIVGGERALHAFVTPQSDAGKAFYTLEMYNKIHGPLVQLDQQMASIQNGEGAAGHLYASDEQYNEILSELRSLRSSLADLNAGKGKFGPWLQDDAGYRRLKTLLASTDATIASLNAGEGVTGRLLANAQLYEALQGSLRSMEELLRDVREHPRKYLRVKPF